jgi:hypothetical protein
MSVTLEGTVGGSQVKRLTRIQKQVTASVRRAPASSPTSAYPSLSILVFKRWEFKWCSRVNHIKFSWLGSTKTSILSKVMMIKL